MLQIEAAQVYLRTPMPPQIGGGTGALDRDPDPATPKRLGAERQQLRVIISRRDHRWTMSSVGGQPVLRQAIAACGPQRARWRSRGWGGSSSDHNCDVSDALRRGRFRMGECVSCLR
jgi:hypothetical protein